ncbi:ribonuclease H-like domain-containing protein [Tanacetum coccineum]
MVTQNQNGIRKTIQHLYLHVSHISALSKSLSHSLSNPHSQDAMCDEYNALIEYGTWVLVPRPPSADILGIDCDGTFSLVVKPTTICTIFSLALIIHWHVLLLDIKKTFLDGDLSETMYIHQPPGFVDPRINILWSFLNEQVCSTAILPIHVDTESKLGPDWTPISNSTLYRSLAGGPHDLTFTQPDSSYDDILLWLTLTLIGLVTLLLADLHLVEYQGVANDVVETTWLHNLL